MKTKTKQLTLKNNTEDTLDVVLSRILPRFNIKMNKYIHLMSMCIYFWLDKLQNHM